MRVFVIVKVILTFISYSGDDTLINIVDINILDYRRIFTVVCSEVK